MEPPESRSGTAHSAAASIAAIGSVLAASACCLPVLPFAVGAGFAGVSVFLTAARPYLLGLSVVFIALGFHQARQAKRCNRKPRIAAPLLLWLSTIFVAISIFFPQTMANAAADLLSRSGRTPSTPPALVNLTPATIGALPDRFNANPNDVRVLVMLSPT